MQKINFFIYAILVFSHQKWAVALTQTSPSKLKEK